MSRSFLSRPFLPRRIRLAALAALSVAAIGTGGAANGNAADPFVAGGVSGRPVEVGSTTTAAAVARGRAVGTALGLPGVRHESRRIDDAFDHRTYDEVTALDGGGAEVAITRFDLDGTLAMAVALGWHPRGGPAIDGPAAANRAVAAVRAAGLAAPGRPVVESSAGAGGWSIAWPRTVDGVAVRGDGIRVLLFADGTFHGLTRSERPLAAGPKRTIDQATARSAATEIVARTGVDPADLAVVGVEGSWVAPNDNLGGRRVDAPGAILRLAWTIRFEARNQLADRLRGVEVWIDAGDGSLLGGDVAE